MLIAIVICVVLAVIITVILELRDHAIKTRKGVNAAPKMPSQYEMRIRAKQTRSAY